ncbi:hypothetical protein [Arthrobacter sp. efr-133-R2A-63]|uniref:hypothetical protein n=1 Tax=Arthrobacter sp. efr-133-R2A-63 TaxID=3040278 RepID=UPI00254C547A|nr:hypothetical protein [Arthrobacter sp. efr-133-R2A-63]
MRLGITWWPDATGLLLVVAGLVWVALGYIVAWTAVLGRDERPVIKDAIGTWFMWCVASQSVAVAAASVGLILYAAVGNFVSPRLMTYPSGRRASTRSTAWPWVPWRLVSSPKRGSSRWPMRHGGCDAGVSGRLVHSVLVLASWPFRVLLAAGWRRRT